MSSEKDILKNPGNNEKLKIFDFSLQSNATKPYDMSRIMGQLVVKTEDETTATHSALQHPTSQEGK